jgi:cytochrome P450
MELNPFSHEFHENPYPLYRWLRDHAPIYRNDALDFWALSRFQDVRDASPTGRRTARPRARRSSASIRGCSRRGP